MAYPPPPGPVIMMGPMYGPMPIPMQCPMCRAQIVTETHREQGAQWWLWCLILFFLGFGLLSLILFCMDNLYDVEHRCPACKAPLGRYEGHC